ncbi:MAG TPA: PDZ domain-containing protein [Polyangia bacterium]|jgi:predicted metalloprotease with PDZ domain|nr:PDZ domain-containing protein [Polyangia bacterium]
MPDSKVGVGDRSAAPIRYRVAMPEPGSHEFELEMQVPALPERATAELVFPAWAPGSYLIRDFVRHVYGLAITDERGQPLPHERLDKQRWRVSSGGRAFRVRYRVFAFEPSVRTSFLDGSHAYWNGTSLFFFVEGELARPCEVAVQRPARSRWRIDTALAAVAGTTDRFRATSFDELVDSPFEVGDHARSSFTVGGTRFDVALYGRHNADAARLRQILRRVVIATARMFGGGFPFRRYLFIIHALPVGSGGLEHRASVTMDIAGLSFEDDGGYQRFADLAAHEFFHAWNVKRIRDTVLGPFDYTRENYTRMLWFHEGFTDYLANLIILRAGVIDETRFWRFIAEDWPRYAGRPGRNETPLDELSFEAWIKLYKPAENHVNRTVSYYEKGLWAGMALDLTLRGKSRGRRGLPELFARLWNAFGRHDRPITERDVRNAAAQVARAPMDAFFRRYIHGTDELPLPALLRGAGLLIGERSEWALEADKPAGERDRVRERRLRAWTGIALHPDRLAVRNVVPDSPAWRAGITFSDEIVAVDGHRVTAASFGKRIADRDPGDRCTITYFRREQLESATLTLVENPERKLVVKPDPNAGREALAIRRGWLGV